MFKEEEILNLVKKSIELAQKKFKKNEYAESEMLLLQIIKITPENIPALQLLGLVQHNLKKYEEAIESFKKCIELDPNNSENYNNIGLCYSNIGNYKKSIEMLNKAIEIDADRSYMYSNLALQHRHLDELDAAIEYFKKSITLKETETAWGMLGGCYGDKKELDQAEICFKKAIELNPNFANAHVDLSNVYQLKGDWEKAWEEYEWRYEVFEQLKVWKNLYNPEKVWKGESLEDKTIILHSEQGSGDTIQYFRYVSKLKAKKIILHCGSDLAVLFTDCVDEILSIDPKTASKDMLPNHDFHCSILSLPYFLKLKEIPPFNLKVNKKIDLKNYDDFFKIGIAWAGNPQHPNDSNRSCYLKYFREIHDIPGIKLFSLVKDIRPRIYRFKKEPIDLTEDTNDMKIINMSDFMHTFKETAEIIASLDLVITVDTSILHLAGSLGKETWAILPYNSDQRWGQIGDKTNWYPSVKLFRQEEKGNWKKVFQEIKKEWLNRDIQPLFTSKD